MKHFVRHIANTHNTDNIRWPKELHELKFSIERNKEQFHILTRVAHNNRHINFTRSI